MTKLEKVLYTARVHTTGGRDGGASRTDDGRLQVALSVPGGHQGGTNPEQLFAACWSACFIGALRHAAHARKIEFPADAAVAAEVDLGHGEQGFFLQARMLVSLPALAPNVAQLLIDAAHQSCPYSKATRGNVDVVISVA